MRASQVMTLLAYYQGSRHCTPCCFTKYAVMQCPFVLITNLHKRNISSVVIHAPEQQHRGPIAGGDENRLNTHTHINPLAWQRWYMQAKYKPSTSQVQAKDKPRTSQVQITYKSRSQVYANKVQAKSKPSTNHIQVKYMQANQVHASQVLVVGQR